MQRTTKSAILLTIVAALGGSSVLAGRSSAQAAKPSGKGGTAAQTATAPAKTLTTTRKIKGFDTTAMDKSVDPCTDFYQFACGTWIKNNPIPSDQSRWGRFNELSERNREVLHEILDRAAAKKEARGPIEQKIGDFYGSCMDEAAIEARGADPIKPELDRIATFSSTAQGFAELARLHSMGVGGLFSFGSRQDPHNAEMMIPNVDQGGLSLPDRDDYLKTDAKSVETRAKFVEHVQNMLQLLGDPADKAAAEAKAVMAIETDLAKASMDRVSRRDPKNTDHMTALADLKASAPQFDFDSYFTGREAPQFTKLNVGNPEFFKQVSGVIDRVPVEDWKTYLRWHLLRSTAGTLSKPFVDEEFRFTGQYLAGQKEQQVRWKRCVRATDVHLGQALGQPYVAETFGADGKQRMLKMVNALEAALKKDIQQLDWMTEDTKKQALVKLAAIKNKIGYPDKWRDYGKLEIRPGDYTGNSMRASAFETDRNVQRIGKPVDPFDWGFTPPTVNASYSGGRNEITFPAGILQPPFFDKDADDAVNYGGIGAVIGHELTHGFDDQGRKYDAKGNLTDWWTPQDGQEFEKRVSCIADEYSGFTATGDVKLNGRLTLGENTADNGGVRIALMALMDSIRATGNAPPKIEGYTPEQRLFLGYGQIWCQNQTEQSARLLARTDPHSPGQYRVNGVVSNMPEFQKAWNCKKGQAMVRDNACHVW